MKQPLIALAIIVCCAISPAQAQKAIIIPQESNEIPSKVAVATPDLPDPVKDVITTKYNEWKLMASYVYEAAPQYYELELKKGDEHIVIQVDAKGDVLH